MIIIVISLIPLAFKHQTANFIVIDKVCVTVFIIDYALRIMTANLKLHKGVASFVFYPITPWAIIDLLSLSTLPSFSIVGRGFRVLRVMRLLPSAKVFRAFKILRYSRNFEIIAKVFRKQRGPLLAVCTLALGYILISALDI